MRRLPLLALAIASTLVLSGCNFFNRGDDTEVTEIEPAPVPGAVEGELPPVAVQSDDAVVPTGEIPVTVVAPDLIESTNPNERAIGVQRSRPDPFASLPIPPTPPEPVLPEGATATAPRAQPAAAGGTAGAGARTGAGTRAGAGAARPATSPTRTAAAGTAGSNRLPSPSAGGGGAGRSPIAAAPVTPLPPVPQPATARGIRVSGVVQINGDSYAIVQVPNEVERYVRPGERIAGGRVLVKRIDTNSVEPRVVLEENGIEVVTTVTAGEADVADAPPTPPNAGLSQAPLASLPSPQR